MYMFSQKVTNTYVWKIEHNLLSGIWNVCGNYLRMNYFLVLDPYLCMIVLNLIFVGILSISKFKAYYNPKKSIMCRLWPSVSQNVCMFCAQKDMSMDSYFAYHLTRCWFFSSNCQYIVREINAQTMSSETFSDHNTLSAKL